MPETVYLEGIKEKADMVLAKLNEVFVEHNVDLPALQFKAVGGAGQTVHSKSQVTVSWEQAYSGLPQQQAQFPVKRYLPWTGVFVVEVVRDLPGLTMRGGEPTPEELSAIADTQMRDAQLMIEAGRRSFEESWEGSGIVDIRASMPNGLLQAVTMTVAIPI